MTNQRKYVCQILHCPRIICQKCYHWYDKNKLKEHQRECKERPEPARKLLQPCPHCRRSMFGYYGDASWAQIDARLEVVMMQTDRLVYRKTHQKPKPIPRKKREIRTTRATSSAPTTKAA